MSPRHSIRRVDYATQGFDECCCREFKPRSDLHGIDGRHRNKLRQSSGQSSDAMLLEEFALMRVASAAVFAKKLTSPADAIQTLVHDDAIACLQISNGGPDLFYRS